MCFLFKSIQYAWIICLMTLFFSFLWLQYESRPQSSTYILEHFRNGSCSEFLRFWNRSIESSENQFCTRWEVSEKVCSRKSVLTINKPKLNTITSIMKHFVTHSQIRKKLFPFSWFTDFFPPERVWFSKTEEIFDF